MSMLNEIPFALDPFQLCTSCLQYSRYSYSFIFDCLIIKKFLMHLAVYRLVCNVRPFCAG